MSEPASARDRADIVSEITTALRQAGLKVGDAEIASMVETHLFVRRGLDALRNRLPKTTEPALAFDSTSAYRSLDDEGNHDGR